MAMASSSSCQVRVGVRIRPLTAQELSQGGKRVVEAVPPTVGIGQRRFTYDKVFDEHVSQSHLYSSVSGPLLQSFLEGYNATIMAYGQTGSGKTFTMGSEAHSDGELVMHPGLIPRFMSDIFENLEQKKSDSDAGKTEGQALLDYSVSASFLEVYGEDVHDLLDKDRKTLPLREDSNGGVVVAGLKSRSVVDAAQALQVLHEGTRNRTTAATLMNLTSSRSHAVFTISLQQTCRTIHGGDVDVTTTSRFTFVDLAGSERMKKTGAEGERAREGIKINEGLLALGNVINALADEERLAKEKKIHVPYRQSKLTRLLQDALGGNSQTLFLACVSPADTNASETLSTLHYANRARNIKNAPTKNVDATVLELQRLYALNYILQCELVKHRFGSEGSHVTQERPDGDDDKSKIGHADESLMKRGEVKQYIQLLRDTAEEWRGDFKTTMSLPSITAGSTSPGLMSSISSSANAAVVQSHAQLSDDALDGTQYHDRFDETILEEVNPEEEMAILDQLLDLQHRDHEYDKEHKKDQEELKLVDGELEAQEALLLQLRDSLKVYHSLKEKYETLMGEVHQLEVEKTTLADQLEKAKTDPTKGCSLAIKKKLEKVEKSLARARSETRKHQQMYRKAEQEAQKCRALETKIAQLKHGKVALMKKQKEAAVRHREYTEAKTREIMALKRKERTTGKQVSKLKSEIQIHKNNLEKRKVYCDKLTGKLKQTEAHLMKLLAMRKRELHSRTSLPVANKRRVTQLSHANAGKQRMSPDGEFFASKSEDLDSARFLLENMVTEKVAQSQMKQTYEEKVAEYAELMRALVFEVEKLNEAKRNLTGDGGDDVKDLVQNVEDLELRLELVGSELDDLRLKLPTVDEKVDETDEECESEKSSMKVLSSVSVQILRTLLWEMVEKRVASELVRQRQASAIERKDSALQILEGDVESLNKAIKTMSEELASRRALAKGDGDPIDQIRRLNDEKSVLEKNFRAANEERAKMSDELANVKKRLEQTEKEKAVAREKLAVAQVIAQRSEDASEVEMVLEKLQSLWNELGVVPAERKKVEEQIRSCLENTCSQGLADAVDLKTKTVSYIRVLRNQISSMVAVLGKDKSNITDDLSNEAPLLETLSVLQARMNRLKPEFESAQERRAKLVIDAEEISASLGATDQEFSQLLSDLIEVHKTYGSQDEHSRTALSQKEKMERAVDELVRSFDDRTASVQPDVIDYGPPDSLKSSHLDACENEVLQLRLLKSENMARNAKSRNEAYDLVQQMHLSMNDLLELLDRTLAKGSNFDLLSKDALEQVVRTVTKRDAIIPASRVYTEQVGLVKAALKRVAGGRRDLSEALKNSVERAQQTLLMTVGGVYDVNEAYASFHNALFRLPPLSQDHIQACITELNALIAGVEAMTQSEVEALTVVWEALSISSSERGAFWGKLEEMIGAIRSKSESPFDSVLNSGLPDREDWLVSAANEARKVYRILDLRLYKLEQVHQEVERLRLKQDTKSRIISMDSEIRILNARLADFEEQKCNKSRLLTKKTGSTTLLKEERFRKQMQGKFTSKLEQLAGLLKAWMDSEGSTFDVSLLSDEVRTLLKSSDKMETWVEQRTEFMHLRTVQSKPAGKRRATEISSTRKRSNESQSSLEERSTDSSSRLRKSARKAKTASGITPPRQTISNSMREPRGKRKADCRSQSPQKPKMPQQSKAVPLSPTRQTSLNSSTSPSSKPSKRVKRESKVILPFGHLLEEIGPPLPNKENDAK